MTHHSLGPWTADGYDVRQTSVGSRHIAYTGPHHTTPDEYPKSCRMVDEANARLIAAAPDLLAVLIELTDIEGPLPGTAEWAKKALAVIAKAKGQTP